MVKCANSGSTFDDLTIFFTHIYSCIFNAPLWVLKLESGNECKLDSFALTESRFIHPFFDLRKLYVAETPSRYFSCF